MAMARWVMGGLAKLGHASTTVAKSAPVYTPITPGSASALLMSMLLMRACACGLRTVAAWAMWATAWSSMYLPLPIKKRLSSTRFMLWPIHLRGRPGNSRWRLIGSTLLSRWLLWDAALVGGLTGTLVAAGSEPVFTGVVVTLMLSPLWRLWTRRAVFQRPNGWR